MASPTETNEPLLPETNLVDLIAVRDQISVKIDPYPSHVVDKVINVFKDGTTVVSERPHVIKDEKNKKPGARYSEEYRVRVEISRRLSPPLQKLVQANPEKTLLKFYPRISKVDS